MGVSVLSLQSDMGPMLGHHKKCPSTLLDPYSILDVVLWHSKTMGFLSPCSDCVFLTVTKVAIASGMEYSKSFLMILSEHQLANQIPTSAHLFIYKCIIE